jgi:hypothetical protein
MTLRVSQRLSNGCLSSLTRRTTPSPSPPQPIPGTVTLPSSLPRSSLTMSDISSTVSRTTMALPLVCSTRALSRRLLVAGLALLSSVVLVSVVFPSVSLVLRLALLRTSHPLTPPTPTLLSKSPTRLVVFGTLTPPSRQHRLLEISTMVSNCL